MKYYFDSYAFYHQHPTNQLIHSIFIPIIMVCTFGLLSHIQFGSVDGGYILWAVGLSWLIFLDWKIALPFSAVAYVGYLLGQQIPLMWLWLGFIGGWGIQFWGHSKFEKNAPATTQNLLFMIVTPLYLFAKLVRYYP